MSRPGRALALVGVVLLLGVSLCAFDGGEVAGMDLCGLVLLPAGVLVGTGPRPLVGRVVAVLIPVHPADTPDPPFPPPRG